MSFNTCLRESPPVGLACAGCMNTYGCMPPACVGPTWMDARLCMITLLLALSENMAHCTLPGPQCVVLGFAAEEVPVQDTVKATRKEQKRLIEARVLHACMADRNYGQDESKS